MSPDVGWLLTDDEVVAVAASHGLAWPAPLPTVDIDDRAQLQAAAFRGDRSLAVRQLKRGGSDGEQLHAVGRAVVGADRTITTYLADESHRRAQWGADTTYFRSAKSWIVDSLHPLGIHRLTEVAHDDVVVHLRTTMGAVVEHGPQRDDPRGGNDRATSWCLLGIDAEARGVLVALRREDVLWGEVDVVDGNVRALDLERTDLENALPLLLGAVA